jgi:hypothetical protein
VVDAVAHLVRTEGWFDAKQAVLEDAEVLAEAACAAVVSPAGG